jgi:hypothetical protein
MEKWRYIISQISAYYQFARKSIILFQNIITSFWKFWIKYNAWNDEISYEKKTTKEQTHLQKKSTFYIRLYIYAGGLIALDSSLALIILSLLSGPH